MASSRSIGGLLGVSLLGLAFVAAGCGGGSSSKADGGTGGSPGSGSGGSGPGSGGSAPGTGGSKVDAAGGTFADQCKAFIKNVCGRINGECKPAGADGGAAAAAECEGSNQVALGCDRAPMSYATCLSDVSGLSCASLVTADGVSLPASCNDPIESTPLSEAQTKCQDLGVAYCLRAAECAGVTMPTPAQLNACLGAFFEEKMPCEVAVSVGPTHGECLAVIKKLNCTAPGDGGAPDGGNPDATDASACSTAITFYGQM